MSARLLRPRMRLAACAVAVLAPIGLVTVMTAMNSTANAATGFDVAPYVDMTNNQEPMLNSAISSGGLKAFTAAFVISSGCTPIWGDTLPVTNDPTVSGEISQAESAGAQLIVSFGGEGGVELAQGCTNQSSLTAAYQSVINTVHPSRIDFDVEGASIADPTSINLRFHAIAALEAANPGLVVSVTIPVLPTGPDNNGQTFLQDAKTDGARIDLVNIMTMDYYGSWDSNPEMGNYAVEAAQDTLSFVKTVWPSDTYANIGVTPMIGQNDDAAEVFTEADAHTLVNFANSNGVGRLAFWSVDRDQSCGGSASGLPACSEISQSPLDFTKIFNGFTGSGGGGGNPPPTTTTTPPPTTTTTTGGGTGGGLIANAGFESGSLSPWTCDAGTGSVVGSPAHSGSHALAAAATNSDDAQCTQTVAVQPNHTYTLSAWVEGNYVYIGDTGTGTSDTNNWTPSATNWTQLSTSFTTGANTSSVTIYVHGWYAQGTVHADDFTLS